MFFLLEQALEEATQNGDLSSILPIVRSPDASLSPIKFGGSDPLGSRLVSQDEDGAKIANRTAENAENIDSLLLTAIRYT